MALPCSHLCTLWGIGIELCQVLRGAQLLGKPAYVYLCVYRAGGLIALTLRSVQPPAGVCAWCRLAVGCDASCVAFAFLVTLSHHVAAEWMCYQVLACALFL
jgi:hypothetical protein